jgi:hypothetical protein
LPFNGVILTGLPHIFAVKGMHAAGKHCISPSAGGAAGKAAAKPDRIAPLGGVQGRREQHPPDRHCSDWARERQCSMGRIFKALLVLVVLGFIGLIGYAYLADLRPLQAEVKVPVTLNVD